MTDQLPAVQAPPLPFPIDREHAATTLLDAVQLEVLSQLLAPTFPEMIDELEERLVVIQLAVTALSNAREHLIAEAAKGVHID